MNKYFSVLIISLFVFSALVSVAQTQKSIDSDRPGQSFSAHTVGSGVLQLQSGLNYKSLGADNANSMVSNLTNIRYGLSEHFEFNGTIGYGFQSTEANTLNGLNNLRLGVRYNFSEQNGYTPGIGVNVDFLFALGTEVYNDPYEDVNTTLIISQKIADKLNAATNVSAYYDQLTGDIFTPYTLNMTYSLSESNSIFAEIYGELQPTFGLNVDAGITHLISEDFLFDFAVGVEDNELGTDFWAEAGVSFRWK